MAIDGLTVAAQIANFLILVWLLKHFLYQRVIDAMDRRQLQIEAERQNAQAQTDEARQEVDREFKRLERTSPQSAEYQVIRTYLELITELPWNIRTEDKIDLARAEEILHEDHYGLEDVKDRVLEFLAVRKLQLERMDEEIVAQEGSGEPEEDSEAGEEPSPDEVAEDVAEEAAEEAAEDVAAGLAEDWEAGRGPILLFVGPPGVGKTSIARSIARSLGRKYVRISLGGARDEADIRGHRRTYVGAMPGRILQGLKQCGTNNPVFMMDEIDKLGVDFRGDPSSALLGCRRAAARSDAQAADQWRPRLPEGSDPR